MYYLHVEMKIIHRDLKGENVFLEEIEGNRLMVKIGDFGLTINIVNTQADKEFNLGTLNWQVF
jgi:serine/threonine protein kinase